MIYPIPFILAIAFDVHISVSLPLSFVPVPNLVGKCINGQTSNDLIFKCYQYKKRITYAMPLPILRFFGLTSLDPALVIRATGWSLNCSSSAAMFKHYSSKRIKDQKLNTRGYLTLSVTWTNSKEQDTPTWCREISKATKLPLKYVLYWQHPIAKKLPATIT